MKFFLKSLNLGYRMFNENDAENFLKNHREEKFIQWFPNNECQNIDDAFETMDFFNDCVNKKIPPYVFAIELLETHELIGDVGINEVEGKSDEIEIGFSICEKYQGLGYATEALRTMSEFIIPLFSIKILYARALKGNEASCKVLEKCGFKYQHTEMGAEDDPYGNGMLVYMRTK